MENKYLKTFGGELRLPLTKLFNEILDAKEIPKQQGLSEIVLMLKKGDPRDVDNYRPISLTSNVSKIFAKLIKTRVQDQLDKWQSQEQACFRKGRSTIDQIFIINQIIDKYNEFNVPLFILLIDIQKAFDSIHLNYLWNALNNHEIKAKYIKILMEMYKIAIVFTRLRSRRVVMCLVVVYIRSFVCSFPHRITSI